MTPLLFLLLGCEETAIIPLHFDGPVAAASIPGGVSPFVDPTGFVANSRSGRISVLQLKEGRFLTDDPMASFLPTAGIATGDGRILSDLVATTDGSAFTVWAADNATQTLLNIPYITGFDDKGNPVEVEATSSDPVLVGSGDASLQDLHLRSGYTTTEDWSIEYDGSRWWAKGSRSGTQISEPVPGEAYQSDRGEVAFTLKGSTEAGGRIDFHTETGIQEWRLGGLISGLATRNGRIYASVAGDLPEVAVIDAATNTWVGAVYLPEGSSPGRMALADDGRIFVADSVLSTVHVLRFDVQSDPGAVTVEEIPAAAPVLDVAWSSGTGRDGGTFEHLFVAPVGLRRVDVWDLGSSSWYDPNPYTPGAEGVDLGAPVSGLASSVGTVFLQQPDASGAYPRVPVVAISTQDGLLYPMEASNGCMVQNAEGPVGPTPYTDSNDDYILLEDQGATSSSTMWIDESSGKQIVTSLCGGVTRAEDWTVTYDAGTLSWEVEGTLSGIQVARAVEDERYISDSGAVSFLIASGTLPPTDGDRFAFTTTAGVASILGTDSNEDNQVDRPWEFPGRPAAFDYLSGPSGGGWDKVDRREFVLLPVENSDIVVRVSLDTSTGATYWN